MTPLGGALLGMIMVALDVRVPRLDVVADPVGWLVLAYSLHRLRSASGWFGAAAVPAAVGIVVSVPGFLARPQGAVVIADILVQTVVVFTMCTGIMETLGPGHPWRIRFDVVRWVLSATYLLALVPLPTDLPVVLSALILLALGAAVLALIGFLVLTYLLRGEPEFAGQAAPA